MSTYNSILKNGLCLGCGLCAAVDKQCAMALDKDGFYRPQGELTEASKKIISKICPGINIKNAKASHSSAWGAMECVSNAWAADKNIRHTSSSGGVTSALAIYLLESKRVDAVLHVGHDDGDYLHNCLHVSRNREEVLRYNASRYAPAAVFDDIFNILDRSDETYAFIGKPCDIAAVRNLMMLYPKYQDRIKYLLSIFCAGMPGYNATMDAISVFQHTSTPVDLRYRGDGWPGYFTVKYEDGTSRRMTYNESWGNILGRQLGFRCKICADGIGLLADISMGDAWNTKDGYPDFTEAEGKNFCFVRTKTGRELFDEAVKVGCLVSEPVRMDGIRHMQPYQYDRRIFVGWRILAVQLLTGGLLHFQKLGYDKLFWKCGPKRALHEFLGTAKRLLKVKMRNG